MHRILVVVVMTGLVACAAEETPVGYGPGLGEPGSPVPHGDAYIVRSHVSVPLGIPAVTAAIAGLQGFSQHGGTTLLAQSADLPAIQALNTLPSTLRAKLDGWIDTELDKQKIGTMTARQGVGQIAVMAGTIVDNFIVESSLSIQPTGAVHSLTDLTFQPLGMDVIVPIGGLAKDKLAQKPTATVGPGGELKLGDQKFSLAFGSHAWQAIDLGTIQLFGGGLDVVEKLDCNAVAQSVAARCVSTTCVGHASDILAVCQHGLTSLIDQLSAALTPVELDSLRFVSGTAHLTDPNNDGIADQILDGTWDTETDTGTGPHSSQVAFTALD
jgi:hypothetical protein